ncbi:MAG: hypothetical protein NWF04_02760 [Candidatus Bathyarchaeota archaeon]|nr:hypothetical protein [Candidatus Bathyarchaeota archaeon]
MVAVTVHVEVEVSPTENEEKVQRALFNLFGSAPVESKPAFRGSVLTIDAKGQESLSTLRNVLRRDRIRDSSRRALRQQLKGDALSFCLNKQVAFAGHVSFCEAEAESPLGPIRVTLTSPDLREIIDWLAPKTSKS